MARRIAQDMDDENYARSLQNQLSINDTTTTNTTTTAPTAANRSSSDRMRSSSTNDGIYIT